MAYGNYRPYSSRSGDLAVVTPAAWIVQGWWSVAPGAQQTLYRSYSDDHIYFRIQDRNGTITPRNYENSAEFCTSSYGFSTIEMDNQTAGNRNNFQISANGSRTNGATCAAAGGEWKTFYKMRAHMDFTVN